MCSLHSFLMVYFIDITMDFAQRDMPRVLTTLQATVGGPCVSLVAVNLFLKLLCEMCQAKN